MQKNTRFLPDGICCSANRQTVYSEQSQNQIHQNLSCLSFKSKENSIIERESGKQIVYIAFCDIEHST